MLQLIFLLGISGLCLWFFNKKSLLVLGFLPNKKTAFLAFILFSLASLICGLGFLLRIYLAKESYVLNHSLTFLSIIQNLGHQVRTVLTEELIFRGALFYILLKKISSKKAILISSIFFGLAHCINIELFKNPMQLLLSFGFPFLMGLVFAYSFVKTQSIIVPFALHFGWNLTQNYIFPNELSTNSVFIIKGIPPTVTISYFSFFCMMYLPKLFLPLCCYFLIRKNASNSIIIDKSV